MHVYEEFCVLKKGLGIYGIIGKRIYDRGIYRRRSSFVCALLCDRTSPKLSRVSL